MCPGKSSVIQEKEHGFAVISHGFLALALPINMAFELQLPHLKKSSG